MKQFCLSFLLLINGSLAMATAPKTVREIIFYTPKSEYYLGYGKDFDTSEANIDDSSLRIVDVELMIGNTRALVVTVEDSKGTKSIRYISTFSSASAPALKNILVSEHPGQIWIRTPGTMGKIFQPAWVETYMHYKPEGTSTAIYMKSLVDYEKYEIYRRHQLETGEYGIHQIQRLIDWMVGRGVFSKK